MITACKRFLSSFLAVLMLVSMVPAEAFADSEEMLYEEQQDFEADIYPDTLSEPEEDQLDDSDDTDAEEPDDADAEEPDNADAEEPDNADAEEPDNADAEEPDNADAEEPDNADTEESDAEETLPSFCVERLDVSEDIPVFALTESGIGEEALDSAALLAAFRFIGTAGAEGNAYEELPASLTVTMDRRMEAGALGLAFYDGQVWKGFWLPAGDRYELFALLGDSFSCAELLAAMPEFAVGVFGAGADDTVAVTFALSLNEGGEDYIELASCVCCPLSGQTQEAVNISESVSLSASEALSISQEEQISAENAEAAVLALIDNTAVSSFETVGFAAAVEPSVDEVADSLQTAADELALGQTEVSELSGSIRIELINADVAPVSFENEEATVTSMTFEVTPYLSAEAELGQVETELSNDLIAAPLSFRLPVSANTEAETASVLL